MRKFEMDNILLAKPVLPSDWIDWAVGEAHVVRRNLFKYFPQLIDRNILSLTGDLDINDLEYQSPIGYKPLVDILEAKYGAPAVITNGAKQALAASVYALKKEGIDCIWLQKIHWALLPPLIHATGMPYIEDDISVPNANNSSWSASLFVAPNNPDGDCPKRESLLEMAASFKKYNMPFVVDSAYYTHSYLPEDYELGPVGDMQIFSFSKMFGLSGVRVGAIVCHDKSFFNHIVEYMEMMTVGVSIFSQKYIHEVFKQMGNKTDKAKEFERANFADLKEAKNILKGVSSEILEVPEDIDQLPGMFCFVKIKKPEAFEKAKLHIVSGEPFGDPSKVRLNLAIGNDRLQNCVDRLNGAL